MNKDTVDLKFLNGLASLMTKHGIAELRIRDGEQEIDLSRDGASSPWENPAPLVSSLQGQTFQNNYQTPQTDERAPVQPSSNASPANQAPTSQAPASQALASQPPAGALTSPMVGTVYLAPQPGAPRFVEVGQSVTQGQIVLLIEAMKVMNQIQAAQAGTVTEILVQDGQPVEYGQPLLVIS